VVIGGWAYRQGLAPTLRPQGNKPEVSPWREILLDAIRTASSSWTSSRSACSSPGYNRAFRRFSATRVNPPPVAFRHLLGVLSRLKRNLPRRRSPRRRLHVATLDAHQPFRGLVYRTAGADGSVVYISTSGKPVFDADSRFLGYRGVSSDVTAAVRAEQVEKELHQAQAELARVTRVTTLGARRFHRP
jgi:hypothetical protein